MSETAVQAGSLRFPKSERLRLRTLVERLFAEGRKVYAPPLRCVWRVIPAGELEEGLPAAALEGVGRVQVMTIVPKRFQRRAVGRVLMRRRMKEAYRLNRHILREAATALEESGCRLSIALLYNHTGRKEYADIREAVCTILARIASKFPAALEKTDEKAD